MTRVNSPHGKCRSCGAAVLWATTKKGKASPFDAEPSMATSALFILAATEPGKLSAHHLSEYKPEQLQGVKRYTSHFITCPNAKNHRQRPASSPAPRRCAVPGCADQPRVAIAERRAGRLRICRLCANHELDLVVHILNDGAGRFLLEHAAGLLRSLSAGGGGCQPPADTRPPAASASPSASPTSPAPEQAGAPVAIERGGGS